MTDLKPGTLVQGTTTAHPYRLLILRVSLHGALVKGVGGPAHSKGRERWLSRDILKHYRKVS